jgi:tetratricopeptide (TPR) repeat protein
MSDWQDLLKQRHVEEALRAYRQEGSDEETVSFLESLAHIQDLLREKNALQAQKVLTQTIPEWAKSLVSELEPQLSTISQAQKDLDRHEAEKTLGALSSFHPLLMGEAETLRGTALIYQNDLSAAKAAFEKALEHDPKHYRAMTNLGNIALEANQLDQAIAHYEQALKLNQNFTNAYHNLAVAYKKKGEVGKSVRALKQAQRASQQKMREEARGMFKGSRAVKYIRWLMFGGTALILYFIFRSQQ